MKACDRSCSRLKDAAKKDKKNQTGGAQGGDRTRNNGPGLDQKNVLKKQNDRVVGLGLTTSRSQSVIPICQCA